MKKLFIIALCFFAICGCKNDVAKSSKTCTINTNNVNLSIMFEAEDNIVKRAQAEATIPEDNLGVRISELSGDEREQINNLLTQAINASDETKGIKMELIYNSNSITMKLNIDMAEADETFLANLGISKEGKTLNEVIEEVSDNGAKCN